MLGSIDEDFDVPMKRGGLLPPIKMETNLPGGINFSVTPEVPRRKSLVTTISPTPTDDVDDDLDNDWPNILTPPSDWMDCVIGASILEPRNELDSAVIDKNWLKHCLNCLLSDEMLVKFGVESKGDVCKILMRDVLFAQKFKKVCYFESS